MHRATPQPLPPQRPDARQGSPLAGLIDAATRHAHAVRDDACPMNSCVVAIRIADGGQPLLFVAGTGTAIRTFQGLARALDGRHSLYVLDATSFGADLAQMDVPAIATRMIADLQRIQPAGPYRLAGHDCGARIAYEIARQLARDGHRVDLLALLEDAAPGYPRLHAFPIRALMHVGYALSKGPAYAGSYLFARIKRMKKYIRPDAACAEEPVTPESLAIRRSAQALQRAAQAFEAQPFAGSMLLIRAGLRDYHPGKIDNDPTQGWGQWVGGKVRVAELASRPEDMLDLPHAAALARLLTDAIDTTGEGEAASAMGATST